MNPEVVHAAMWLRYEYEKHAAWYEPSCPAKSASEAQFSMWMDYADRDRGPRHDGSEVI